MTQVRLNSLMVLHIHSDKTDSLNLYSIGDQFVGSREGRLRVFGFVELFGKFVQLFLCNSFFCELFLIRVGGVGCGRTTNNELAPALPAGF